MILLLREPDGTLVHGLGHLKGMDVAIPVGSTIRMVQLNRTVKYKVVGYQHEVDMKHYTGGGIATTYVVVEVDSTPDPPVDSFECRRERAEEEEKKKESRKKRREANAARKAKANSVENKPQRKFRQD